VKLLAVSDLHVASAASRRLVSEMPAHPDDWLVLARDIGETARHLEWTLETLRHRFRQLVWVPGNHDLWTLPSDADRTSGEAHYQELVAICRSLGVLTPEDPYPTWRSGTVEVVLAPLFLLYDYTFRPRGTSKVQALAEAYRVGVVCTDEYLLHPNPYPSRETWCWARVERTAERLAAIPADLPTVLVSHFPLRHDLVWLPRIPQFSLWCGTTRTHDWHVRYRAAAVVYGHLHIPRTSWCDGVRFEEVSAGHAQGPITELSPARVLRQVLPALNRAPP
jgi:3',5'-cyclic AMP phosphodiesterase CpdA